MDVRGHAREGYRSTSADTGPLAKRHAVANAMTVFEVLLSTYPRVWRRLSLSQNVAYLLRCTYYLIGPLFLVHALLA